MSAKIEIAGFDFSDATVTANTLLAGTKAYNKDGDLITGTYKPTASIAKESSGSGGALVHLFL